MLPWNNLSVINVISKTTWLYLI